MRRVTVSVKQETWEKLNEVRARLSLVRKKWLTLDETVDFMCSLMLELLTKQPQQLLAA